MNLKTTDFIIFLPLMTYFFVTVLYTEKIFCEITEQYPSDIFFSHEEKKIENLIHFENIINKNIKGFNDPVFPKYIHVCPNKITIPEELSIHIKQILVDDQLIFSEIKGEDLNSLSSDPLEKLLFFLRKIPVKIKWKDKNNKIYSGKKILKKIRKSNWNESNASGALAFVVGTKKDRNLLLKMITLDPDSIIFAFQKEAAAMLDIKLAAKSIVGILQKLTPENTRQIASSTENISQVYIEYWAKEEANKLIIALTSLIVEVTEELKSSSKTFNFKQNGILIGSLLAGSMAHAQKIKSKDERRLWIVNSISNLAWATTVFIGMIPIAGSIVAGIQGTISVGVVVWAVIYNKIGVRDYTPKIKEVEGHIEFAMLEMGERKKNTKTTLDLLETLAWMRAAIHVNGFFD